MALGLRYAARSDTGMVRTANEDSGYAGARMLVVADGMGGHAAGELASATAVATLADVDVQQDLQPEDEEVLGVLAGAVDEAHETLGRIADEHPESRGMGTTITALAWLNDRIAIAHIGDSRAYLLRDGTLTQLTHDHTYVQTLVDAGQITAEEAQVHERRNLLTKALDGLNPVDCDLSVLAARRGDRLLVCSDGLHGVVPVQSITEVLASGADPTGAVDELVEQALDAGAPDNVTALVADVIESDDAGPAQVSEAIVVGAAAETANRQRLPGLQFPDDQQPDATADGGQGPPASGAQAPSRGESAAASRVHHPWRWFVAGGVVLAVVALAIAGWVWTRTQYYVGDSDGSVAIFQGIPQGPGSNGLSTVEEVSSTKVAQLPEFERDKVEARIPAENAEDALRIVATLEAAAERCSQPSPPAGCPAPSSEAATDQPTAPASPAAALTAPAAEAGA